MKELYEYNYEERQSWKGIGEKLPMTLKWDDLKEGMICHIPPILDKHRCNIKIIGKNGYWIRIQYLNTKEIHFDYLYNYDIESKFLTEVKV